MESNRFWNTPDGGWPANSSEMEDAKLRYAKNRSNEARAHSQHGKGFDPNRLDQADREYWMGGMGKVAGEAAVNATKDEPPYKIISEKLPNGVTRETVVENDEPFEKAYAEARYKSQKQLNDRYTKDPFPKKKPEPPKAPDDDKVKRPKY